MLICTPEYATELSDKVERLEAENERLKAVLTEISQMKTEDLHIADGFGFDNFAAYHAAMALKLAEQTCFKT